MSKTSQETPKPKIPNLEEIWEIRKRWKSSSPHDIKKVMDILYPGQDFSKYAPGDVVQLLIYGLYTSGFSQFSDFMKSITNGKSD